MHGNFTRENRETLLPSAASEAADRWEKAMSSKTHMHGEQGVAQRHSTDEAVERRPGRAEGDRGGKAVDQGERGRA